jgi:hypothetical protein
MAAEEYNLEELAKELQQFVRAQDLPEQFAAVVTDVQVAPDKTGRKCVYFTLELPDRKRTKVKFTPMHLPDLCDELLRLGFHSLNEVKGAELAFKKRHYRIGYPRPMPVERIGKGKGGKNE